MELVKNIFFNTDKLIENTKVKISYTGKLFQDGSTDVFIHFGYGLQWDNVSDIKMEKTELGYQAEIDIINSSTLNFCFRNSANVWDNNEGNNYIFPIEKADTSVESDAEDNSDIMALVTTTPRKLRKSYLWSKKIRIALYKILIAVPKLVSGNLKKKVND